MNKEEIGNFIRNQQPEHTILEIKLKDDDEPIYIDSHWNILYNDNSVLIKSDICGYTHLISMKTIERISAKKV